MRNCNKHVQHIGNDLVSLTNAYRGSSKKIGTYRARHSWSIGYGLGGISTG